MAEQYSGRDWRTARRSASQTAARDSGKGDSPGGKRKKHSINVRILGATNRDLEQAVAAGTFRRNLFFRLNVLSVRIPSAARTAAGYPPARRTLPKDGDRTRFGVEKTHFSDDALKALMDYEIARECPRTGESLERACALSSRKSDSNAGDLPARLERTGESPCAPGGRDCTHRRNWRKQTILNALAQVNRDKS